MTDQLDLFGSSSAPTVTKDGSGGESVEEYLARGVARWSAMCFLWAGRSGKMCAPYFGDSLDVEWRPRWMSRETAERILWAGGYRPSSLHHGLLPGTTEHAKASGFRVASQGVHVDHDAQLRAIALEVPTDDADGLFNSLRELRREAVADVKYRSSAETTDV